MASCFAGMMALHDLGANIIPFLGLFGVAYLAYGGAVRHLLRKGERQTTLALIVGLAVLFRVMLLFTTPPTLSNDVYRYMWDGRLSNAGVNPYAYVVDSPQLDWLNSPQRALVDHTWMASPYLPTAQAFFAAVHQIAPDSPLAFQLAAVVLDLTTGWLVIDLLRRLGQPRSYAAIYLWNPLVVVEFSHGAHVDALMICLMMLALWALVAARTTILSALVLAAATLTKGLPVLLLPVVVRRWRWGPTILYGTLLAAAALPFALGAGWSISGPLDGTGLFGALRIYAARWNYNGGLYHWLEVFFSGYQTPGAVPQDVVGWQPILAAKLVMAALLGLVLVGVWRAAQRCSRDLVLMRLALVPLVAYLLLTTTVHPWYVTLIVPLLPFLPSQGTGAGRAGRFLLPLLYLVAAIALSYLTYLDPENLREYGLVRIAEYVPVYLTLILTAWPASGGAGKPGIG